MSAERKKPPRKKALGRGLAALLGDGDFPAPELDSRPQPGEKVVELPLERIEPNPFQPRRAFEPQALEALAQSIARHGLLQPVVVRPVAEGYQLIAGERRLRACQMAGLTAVPVVIRQATDEQALLLALLENLQREDLNPLEEAQAYARLVEGFGLSQEEVAQAVGKDRSTVANALRLLKLPDDIRDDLAAGRLSSGHARALLALPNTALMRRARDQILKQGLSVRAAERLVKKLLAGEPAPAPPPDQDQVYIQSLADELRRHLGTKVAIQRKGRRGRIVIEFSDDRELERLLDLLRRG